MGVLMEDYAEILIAGSDARQTMVLRETLCRLGDAYRVTTAQNVSEMRARACDADIDLLVMDAQLLREDRVGVGQLFEQCSNAAIIWLTANGCHVLKPVLAAGPQPYCCFDKPVEIARLRQAAETLLQLDSNPSNAAPLLT